MVKIWLVSVHALRPGGGLSLQILDQFIWWRKLRGSIAFRLQQAHYLLLLVKFTVRISCKEEQSRNFWEVCSLVRKGVLLCYRQAGCICRFSEKKPSVALPPWGEALGRPTGLEVQTRKSASKAFHSSSVSEKSLQVTWR